MGKESPCGVCGETETRLVDGFYYCAECGTQDINLQETVVEHTLRADGTALVARRSRYRLNIDDGVEMSMEWYKWHKYNFLLAGLTEQLIELGAAPSLRMKVLWIWSRYIKMFQKKEEMGPAPVLSQLNVSSSSSEDEAEQEPADAAPRKGKRLDRVTCYLLVAILGLALNVDRSAILESRFTRLLRWRLVPVADIFRHVPAEILRKTRQHRRLFAASSMLTGFSLAPYLMCRVSKLLELGGPLTPDLDAIVHSQLRELRLPRALSQLVRALMHAAPVPFATRRKERFDKQQGERFPEYETTVMAYVMVALKMCFGLDDARERALSAAVDAINEEAGHPRAYTSDPEPTGRLFSFREWAAHLQLRALLTTAHCAPLAWSRAEPAQDLASLEQFRDHTVDHAADPHKSIKKGSKARLTDQVTMEILDRIPQRSAARVLSRTALAPALAAREPAAAVARAVMDLLPPEQRRLLDEDFTHYSLDYAFKHLALPAARADSELFRGVRPRDAGGETFGSDVYYSLADAALVFIKNCSNEHWAEAPRARLSRELDEHAERDSRESLEERRLETFLEEDDGCNIFDDDFSDIPIKDEKMDPNVGDAPEDVGLGDELDDWALPAVERSRRSRDTFDSDDEPEPQFDPRAFDRREVIKELMRGAYERCHLTQVPVRFLSHGEKTRTKADRAPADVPLREFTRGVGSEHWDNKLRARARTQRVEELLADYRRHLRGDALHQLERSVRAFTAAADAVLEPDLTLHESALPEAADQRADVDDSGDVELLENETKKDEDDEDSCEDRAYDPVLKSGADFDEKTHDVDRLFVRLKSPAPESEEHGIEVDDGLAAIVDRAIGKRTIKALKKIETKVIETDVDRLVDDPERVTEFNYWFLKFDKHFQTAAGMPARRMERALEAASPRGFWRVLREAAAALAAPPLRLARRLADVEHRLLRLLATLRKTARGGKPGRPRKNHENHERPERTNRYSKRKRGRPRKERRLEESDSPSNPDRRRETFEDVGASGNRDRSDISDSQECNPERLCEGLEDSSASQNKLRERKKPRKTMDSSSEDGEPRRSRWGRSGTRRRPETTGDDSEDSSGSGGRERPRTRGRPRQTRQRYISGKSSESETSRKRLENFSSSKNRGESEKIKISREPSDDSSEHSDSQDSRSDKPKKRLERARNMERLSKREKCDPAHETARKNLSDTSDSQNCNPGRFCVRSEDSSTSHNNPGKRENSSLEDSPCQYSRSKRRRILSEDSDSDESGSERSKKDVVASSSSASRGRGRDRPRQAHESGQEDDRTSQNQEQLPRSYADEDSLELSRSRKVPERASISLSSSHIEDGSTFLESTRTVENASQKLEQPKKRGRPRKYVDRESSGKKLQTPDQPRKRGRPRKCVDVTSPGKELQTPEQPRKRGRPRKYVDGKPPKGKAQSPDQPRHEIVLSDKSISNDKDVNKLEPENKDLEESRSLRNQDQPRKHEKPLKSLGESHLQDSDSSGQEDDNTSRNPEQLPRSYEEENSPEQGSSHEKPSVRSSIRLSSSHIEDDCTGLDSTQINKSASQKQEQPKKTGKPRKYMDGKSPGKKLQTPEQPRKRGRPRKYAFQHPDEPRKRGRPRKYFDKDLQKEALSGAANSHKESMSEKITVDRECIYSSVYSDSSCEEDERASDNQDQSKRRGRSREYVDDTHESDTNQEQQIRRKSLHKNHSYRIESKDMDVANTSQDESTQSPDQLINEKLDKSTDESLSEDSDSEKMRPENKDLQYSSSMRNQDKPRKREKPLKSSDESLSDDSHTSGQEDDSISQNQKQLPRSCVDEDPPEQCSSHEKTPGRSSTCLDSTRTDENASQKLEQPRKRGRPRKYMDGKSPGNKLQTPEQSRKRGRPRKYAFQHSDEPRKRGRPRKYFDKNLQKEVSGAANSHKESMSEKIMVERESMYSSVYTGSDSSCDNSDNHDQSERRGRPPEYVDNSHESHTHSDVNQEQQIHRKSLHKNHSYRIESKDMEGANTSQDELKELGSLRILVDENDSGTSDSESFPQECPRKRGRPLKYVDGNRPQPNHDPPRKRGRPRKSLDINLSEEYGSPKQEQRDQPKKQGRFRTSLDAHFTVDRDSLNPGPPRKRGRPRKSFDINLSGDRDSPKLDQPLKRGRPRKSMDGNDRARSDSPEQNTSRKRGRPRKFMDANVSVDRDSPNHGNPPKKLRRPHKSLDMHLSEDSESPKQDAAKKRGRPRKSMDNNITEQVGSGSPEQHPPKKRGRPRKSIDGNVSEGSDSKQHQPRKPGRPPKRFHENLLDTSSSQSTSDKSTTSSDSNHIERPTSSEDKKGGSDSQSGKCSKNESEDVVCEAKTILQEKKPEQSNSSKDSEDASVLKSQEQPRMESVEDNETNNSQEKKPNRPKPSKNIKNKEHPSKEGKPRKFMDSPEISVLYKKPIRPSAYLGWRPLGNASTPQHTPNQRRFSSYGDRSLVDLSAIQGAAADASLLQNKTVDYSETKVINFDQF